MRLEGDGFVLRIERPDDAPAIARAFADDPHLAVDWGIEEVPDEAKALEWVTRDAELWVQGEGRHFAIADPDGDALIGGLNFHQINPMHRRAEIGFWLAPGARGRGIAPRAVTLACEWAFEHYDLDRIEMTTLPDNAATLRLAEKVGFQREGLLRERNFERGARVDIVMLSLLRRELS